MEEEGPVVIPIRLPSDIDDGEGDPGDCNVPEWALIEVNGELLLPQTAGGKENGPGVASSSSWIVDPERIELGSLRFVDGKPVLIVGSHELTGTVVSLAQPFCVLERRSRNYDGKVVSRSSSNDNDEEEQCYIVQGIVTRKILMNQYPKVLVKPS